VTPRLRLDFRGEAVTRVRIALGLKGEGDAIRLRLAIDVPTLKLLVTAGQEMQKPGANP
jgi:hypothetical protein